MSKKARKIRTSLDKGLINKPQIVLGGWYDGRHSYLWFGDKTTDRCMATLSGQKLYNLAKNIVKQFEEVKK